MIDKNEEVSDRDVAYNMSVLLTQELSTRFQIAGNYFEKEDYTSAYRTAILCQLITQHSFSKEERTILNDLRRKDSEAMTWWDMTEDERDNLTPTVRNAIKKRLAGTKTPQERFIKFFTILRDFLEKYNYLIKKQKHNLQMYG